MDLSPQDRDLTIRTVLGEAGDQPLAGQAAVASVIFNRAQSPQWGGSPSKVVLAPGQFEPWQTRARQLLSYAPDSPEYQGVGQVVDKVASGEIPDPTGGATYFLNPSIVRARRGGTLPSWASGRSVTIGQHQFFFGPEDQKVAQNAPEKSGAAAPVVTDEDAAATAKVLGLNVPELAAPQSKSGYVPVSSGGGVTVSVPAAAAGQNSPAITDDDINATAKTLGLKLDNAAPANQPPATTGTPAAPSTPSPSPLGPMGYEGQILEGMPVVAPLAQKAIAASNAAIEPAVNVARGWMGKAPLPVAPTFGERYAANLAGAQGESKQFAADNPVGSTIANLTGGAMILGPVADTSLGGLLLGTRGPSAASRVLGGAGGGATLSALDALLRGENPGSAAELGAVGGAAGPIVGEGARGAINAVGRYVLPKTAALRNLTGNAVDRLIAAMEGETPQSMTENAARMGPSGFVGDINPAFTDIAGGIADTPGPGKQVVREAYQARARDQRNRVDQAITDAYGIPAGVNVNQFKNFLTETRAAAADPLYEQYRSMPVHPTDELKDLIPRLDAAGAFNMAEELSGISGRPINKNYFTSGDQKSFPTAEGWDYVKRGLDRRIDQAYTGGDKTLGRELTNLKQELIDEIEKTDAGKVWKQARTEFADRSAILDQIDAGRDDFIGGRSGLSADELADELSTLRGPELSARMVGQRAAIEQAMGDTLRGDTTLRNKLLAPNNIKKLELTLGKNKAQSLIQALEQEKYLGDQYQNVVGGSQTTPKKERVNALAAPAMQPWDLDVTKPMTYLPPSMREQFTVHGLVNAWRGQNAARAAEELAPLVTLPAADPRHGALLRALVNEGQRRAPWAAAPSP